MMLEEMLEEMIDQRLRALQTCARFDHELDLLREASRTDPTLCVVVSDARHTLRRLDRDIAQTREEQRKAEAEAARYERAPVIGERTKRRPRVEVQGNDDTGKEQQT